MISLRMSGGDCPFSTDPVLQTVRPSLLATFLHIRLRLSNMDFWDTEQAFPVFLPVPVGDWTAFLSCPVSFADSASVLGLGSRFPCSLQGLAARFPVSLAFVPCLTVLRFSVFPVCYYVAIVRPKFYGRIP